MNLRNTNFSTEFAFMGLIPEQFQGLNLPMKSNKVLAVNKIIERNATRIDPLTYISERHMADARFNDKLWSEKCARIKRAIRNFTHKRVGCVAPEQKHFISVFGCNKSYGFANTSSQYSIRFEDNIRKSLVYFGYDVVKYWFSFQGKPINIEKTFGDYNISNGSILQAHLRVRGGVIQPSIFGCIS